MIKAEALITSNFIINKRLKCAFKQGTALTYTEFVFLSEINRNGPIQPLQLNKRFHMKGSTLNIYTKKLFAKQYIEKERCKEDERTILLSITAAGREALAETLTHPHITACLNDEY